MYHHNTHDPRYCVDCGISFRPRFGYESRCYTCYLTFKDKRSALPDPAEWRAMLPLLIRLAHPDRHGGSELSTKTTQWLLQQRNRLPEVRK